SRAGLGHQVSDHPARRRHQAPEKAVVDPRKARCAQAEAPRSVTGAAIRAASRRWRLKARNAAGRPPEGTFSRLENLSVPVLPDRARKFQRERVPGSFYRRWHEKG